MVGANPHPDKPTPDERFATLRASMPELPEVEVVRRGLAPRLQGRLATGARVRAPRLRWPVPADLGERIAGRRVLAVERRGKYLLLDFAHGSVLVHLGMSGSLRFDATLPPPRPHDHVDLVFEHGTLRLHDPRRFGAVLWLEATGEARLAHPLLAGLGIEPFDPRFDGAWLHRASRGRRVAIKQFLLAGHAVVGVGNIYASESLFRAGIRPTRPAQRVSRARYDALAGAIRDTLAEAIARGGSTLRDFSATDGESGYFQADAQVYDREGLPCRRCGAPVRRIVQQMRSTFFCAGCQR